MITACNPGGTIFLEHGINEGLKENYEGLHRWNFLPVDNDLVIWGKNVRARKLSSLLSSAPEINMKTWETSNGLVMVTLDKVDID